VRRLIAFLPARRNLPATGGRAALGPATVVSYLAFEATATRPRSGETPITLLPKAAAVELVFDAADVLTTEVGAPRLSEPRLRQALPNLLEDRLLSDPADCHFAFSVTSAAGAPGGAAAAEPGQRIAVAAIDRGTLTRALDAFVQAGYRPRAAYSELYAVPAPAGGVLSVRADRGRGVARTAPHEGVGFDIDGEAPAALLLAIRQLGVRRIQAYGRDAAKLAQLAARLGVAVDDVQHDANPEAMQDAVNLLQGPFAPAGRFSFASGITGAALRSGAWKAPAAWAGVCAAVYIAGLNAYWLKLDAESSDLRAGMQSAFRNAFPNQRSVVDPIAQTAREMNALRARAGLPSPDDFSVLNAQAAKILAGAPLGVVAGIDYRDRVLIVRFKPGAAENPALRNALRAQAVQLGLGLRFESDNSARLTPAGI
jgi:general secretion pathway protein L